MQSVYIVYVCVLNTHSLLFAYLLSHARVSDKFTERLNEFYRLSEY